MNKPELIQAALKFFKKKGFPPHDHEQQQAESYAEFFIELSAPEDPEEEIMTANEFFNKLMECDSYSIDQVEVKVKGGTMSLTGFTMQTESKQQGEVIEGGAIEIVRELAEWSKKYPRNKVYNYSGKKDMDGQLVEIENKATDFINKLNS